MPKKKEDLGSLIERMKKLGFYSDYLNNKDDIRQILI